MSDNSVSLTLRTDNVQFFKTNSPDPDFSFRAQVLPTSNGFFSTDEEGKKLAQELNKEPISIQVDLSFIKKETHASPPTWLYDLRLESNVLQILKDRFQDVIECSVKVAPDWSYSFTSAVPFSARKMTISPEKSSFTRRLTRNEICMNAIGNMCKWTLSLTIRIPFTSGVNSRTPSQSDEPYTSQTILEEALFSDVVITAGNGAEIKAHKSFLTAASPVLRATFTNKMKESLTGTLDMTDMSEKGVWAFLYYIYTKDLSRPKNDAETAFDLLRAAHKYEIPKLETFMVTQLQEANKESFDAVLAFRMYSFVKVWDSKSRLKGKAIRILKAKCGEFIKSEEYRELFKDGPSKSVDELFLDFAQS